MVKVSKASDATKYAYLYIIPILRLFKKCTVRKKNNFLTPKFQTPFVTINNFPVLYDQHHKVVLPVAYHFFDLKLHKFQKSLTQTANALLYYWRFLETEDIKWDNFSVPKFDRPTYLFRNALQSDIQRKVISPSTASSYMNYVIKFYAWAISSKLLFVKKNNKPFEYEEIIVNKASQNRASGFIRACTTDLRIRAPKMQAGTLRPLVSEQLKVLMQALLQEHIELRLMIHLALLTGMRQGEICSLAESCINLFDAPSQEISIGPGVGVNTKFEKTRLIEMPKSLMTQLWKYRISERRMKRLDKWEKANTGTVVLRPLFLTQTGDAFGTATVRALYSKLRMKINESHPAINFTNSFHDLRATYATSRLMDLRLHFDDHKSICILKRWLGHESSKTLWKYINFIDGNSSVSKITQSLEVELACFLEHD